MSLSFLRHWHVRGAGFERDAEKPNAAVMAGWRVLHFTPRHVRSGIAVRMIEALMMKKPARANGKRESAEA